jgi:hypothetical protein
MASEPPERHPVPVTVPPSLDEWLSEHTDSADVDREELLVQLVAAYQVAAEDGDAAAALADAAGEIATDTARERVDERLGSFRSSLDSQLQAIRKRIVQLKHESEEKAEASRVRELVRRTKDVEERVADVQSSVETLREEFEEERATEDEPDPITERVNVGEAGSDPELVERLDEVESKLVRVAQAVVELRETEETRVDDTAFHGLKRVAAREGVHEATCTACEEGVDLTLLAEPACPHCGSRFDDLDVDTTVGEPRLVGGDDGRTDDEDADPSSPEGERSTGTGGTVPNEPEVDR